MIGESFGRDQAVLVKLRTTQGDGSVHKVRRVVLQFGDKRKRSFFGLHRFETTLARGSFSKKIGTGNRIAAPLLVVFGEGAKALNIVLDLGGIGVIIKYTPTVTAVERN